MNSYGCDLDYRPASYWSGPESVFANVKGEHRRRSIRRRFVEGADEEIPEAVLADSLAPELRHAFGAVHPQLMGGEYLPDAEAGEVEIARVSLHSTCGDVETITAEYVDGAIRYCQQDEYGKCVRLVTPGQREPLTLRQLVLLIEGVPGNFQCRRGIVLGDLYHCVVGLCGTPDEYRAHWQGDEENRLEALEARSGFYTVSSEYYDELGTWFSRAIAQMAARLRRGECGPDCVPVHGEDFGFLQRLDYDPGRLGYTDEETPAKAAETGEPAGKTRDFLGHLLGSIPGPEEKD